MIKVLLADDAAVIRSAVKQILLTEPRIRLIGEAATFKETVKMADEHKPDLILLDLHMPERENYDASAVKSSMSGARCLVTISLSNDDGARVLSDEYGATALLDKMNLGTELLPTIRDIFYGGGRRPDPNGLELDSQTTT